MARVAMAVLAVLSAAVADPRTHLSGVIVSGSGWKPDFSLLALGVPLAPTFDASIGQYAVIF